MTYTTAGTVVFNPTKFPGHHPGDNIFNFTNITIGNNVTVTLSADYIAGPVYWLASGTVQINGKLDLKGAQGFTTPTLQASAFRLRREQEVFPEGSEGTAHPAHFLKPEVAQAVARRKQLLRRTHKMGPGQAVSI